jgi:hypothetical protein
MKFVRIVESKFCSGPGSKNAVRAVVARLYFILSNCIVIIKVIIVAPHFKFIHQRVMSLKL